MGLPAPESVGGSGLPPVGDQANAVVSGVIVGVGPTQPFAFRGPMNVAAWGAVVSALTTTAGSLTAAVASATGIAAGYGINSVNVPPGTTVGVLAGTVVTLAVPPITLRGRTDGVDGNVTIANAVGSPSMASLVGALVSGPGIPTGTTVLSVVRERVNPTNGPIPGIDGIVRLSNSPLPLTAFKQQAFNFYTFVRNGNAIGVSGADAAAIFTGAGVNFTGSIQLERSFDGGQTWLVANVGGSGTLAIYTAGTPVNLTFGEPEKQVLYRLNCTALTAGTINYRLSQTGGAAESLTIQLI